MKAKLTLAVLPVVFLLAGAPAIMAKTSTSASPLPQSTSSSARSQSKHSVTVNYVKKENPPKKVLKSTKKQLKSPNQLNKGERKKKSKK